MSDDPSQRRKAANEVIFRAYNDRVGNAAQKVLDAASKRELPVGFVCECADKGCNAKIELTVADYLGLRRNQVQFMVLPGHEHLDIERVVRTDRYNVVEKFETPPSLDSSLGSAT